MQIKSRLFSGFYGLATLLVALAIAWAVLAGNNYFYGFWHDKGGIGEAIDKYGPQNRYREGFADTNREQRVLLFGKIVEAVHNHGEGLEQIFYLTPSNAPGVPLLHQAEIIHLRDVAALIDMITYVLIFAGLFWLGSSAFLVYRKRALPGAFAQIVGFAVIFLIGGLVILLFGWEPVFNQLHIWIFPEEHQWFFYYQDSLMSTMMWAPHLFKYIGLSWLVLTIVVFSLLLWGQQLLNRRLLKRPEHRG